MKKIKFKYGSISWNKNDMFVYLSNKSNYKQHEESNYKQHEDIELIINDDNTLEINSKQLVKESVYFDPFNSECDLSIYDLSEFKNTDEYIYERTSGFLWNKKTTRYINKYLTLKERIPFHIVTSVKWYIWSDEDLNWNWSDSEK
jgi:hypothetical protein